MIMNSGNSSIMNSTINMTPMIDVLLVLLIIFMVIVPVTPKGESVLAPKPAIHGGGSDDAVVLEVLKRSGGDVGFRINQHNVARQDLLAEITAIYANRANRVMFVKGDDGLSFTEVDRPRQIGNLKSYQSSTAHSQAWV